MPLFLANCKPRSAYYCFTHTHTSLPYTEFCFVQQCETKRPTPHSNTDLIMTYRRYPTHIELFYNNTLLNNKLLSLFMI